MVKLSVTENNQAFWKKFLNLLWIVSAIKLKCFTYFLLNSHTKVNRLSTVLLNDRIARISAVLIKLHLNYSTLPLLISNSQHALFFLLISSYIQQIGLTFCAVSQVQLSSQMDICYTEPNLDACHEALHGFKILLDFWVATAGAATMALKTCQATLYPEITFISLVSVIFQLSHKTRGCWELQQEMEMWEKYTIFWKVSWCFQNLLKLLKLGHSFICNLRILNDL